MCLPVWYISQFSYVKYMDVLANKALVNITNASEDTSIQCSILIKSDKHAQT